MATYNLGIANLIPQAASVGSSGWSTGAGNTTYANPDIGTTAAVRLQGTTSTGEATSQLSTTVNQIQNHIYYARIYEYHTVASFNNNASWDLYWPIEEPLLGQIKFGSANKWNMLSMRNSRTNWASGSQAIRIDFNNLSVAGYVWYTGLMLVDLTVTFGSGNEPTKEWCDTNIKYYAGKASIVLDPSIRIKPGDIFNCAYSGSEASITLPEGKYKIECWGGKGGKSYGSSSVSQPGGNGGYSVGTYTSFATQTLYLSSGGAGPDRSNTNNGNLAGGWNGGGNSGYKYSGAGGGATHVALRSGLLSSLANYKNDIIMVAGGGGGSGSYTSTAACFAGGNGGGITGVDGITGGTGEYAANNAKGGSQTAGGAAGTGSYSGSAGSFGQGGAAYASSASYGTGGGGGGGFYGGGGGNSVKNNGYQARLSSGGGGSGYIKAELTDASSNKGWLVSNPGGNDGYIRITVLAVRYPSLAVKTDNSIKENNSIYANINNTWKKAKEIFVNIDGKWRKSYWFGTTKTIILPSQYTEIQYIESDGNAYINTGRTTSSNYLIDCKMEITGSALGNYWFGQTQNSNAYMYNGLYNYNMLEYNYADFPRVASNICEMTQRKQSNGNVKITINGVSSEVALGTNASNTSFLIFACNNVRVYGSGLRLYYFKIYNSNNVLEANYIPCYRDNDHAIGLYDLVNSTFLTNAGSGNFFAGPEV